jgi:hypothetical protein
MNPKPYTASRPPAATDTSKGRRPTPVMVTTPPPTQRPVSPAPTDGGVFQTANGRQVANFYPGGHSGLPKSEVFSPAAFTAADLADLHARQMQITKGEPARPTGTDFSRTRAHAKQADCPQCKAWLGGLQAGMAEQHARQTQPAPVASERRAASAASRRAERDVRDAMRQTDGDDLLRTQQPDRWLNEQQRRRGLAEGRELLRAQRTGQRPR